MRTMIGMMLLMEMAMNHDIPPIGLLRQGLRERTHVSA
jgi:hypothetical protein